MSHEEITRVQKFLEELSELSRRTGITVCERYDSVCLNVAQAGHTREGARGYIVNYDRSDGILGRFADLRWDDYDACEDTRPTMPHGASVLQQSDHSQNDAGRTQISEDEPRATLPNGPELAKHDRGW